jgi:riboflavin kinase/FMN adenylyltransferase
VQRKSTRRQHRGQVVLMTFDPHPLQVLATRCDAASPHDDGAPHSSTRGDEGGWCACCVPLTERWRLPRRRTSCARWLQAANPLGCISVGYEWAFGRGREGNVHLLMELGAEHGVCGLWRAFFEARRSCDQQHMDSRGAVEGRF